MEGLKQLILKGMDDGDKTWYGSEGSEGKMNSCKKEDRKTEER